MCEVRLYNDDTFCVDLAESDIGGCLHEPQAGFKSVRSSGPGGREPTGLSPASRQQHCWPE